MTTMNGKEFREYIDTPLYKVIRSNLTAHNFKYELDKETVDTVEFRPAASCGYGMYFTDAFNIAEFTEYDYGTNIVNVEIPDTARAVWFATKGKCDKIILSNLRDRNSIPQPEVISDKIIEWFTTQEFKDYCSSDQSLPTYVKNLYYDLFLKLLYIPPECVYNNEKLYNDLKKISTDFVINSPDATRHFTRLQLITHGLKHNRIPKILLPLSEDEFTQFSREAVAQFSPEEILPMKPNYLYYKIRNPKLKFSEEMALKFVEQNLDSAFEILPLSDEILGYALDSGAPLDGFKETSRSEMWYRLKFQDVMRTPSLSFPVPPLEFQTQEYATYLIDQSITNISKLDRKFQTVETFRLAVKYILELSRTNSYATHCFISEIDRSTIDIETILTHRSTHPLLNLLLPPSSRDLGMMLQTLSEFQVGFRTLTDLTDVELSAILNSINLEEVQNLEFVEKLAKNNEFSLTHAKFLATRNKCKIFEKLQLPQSVVEQLLDQYPILCVPFAQNPCVKLTQARIDKTLEAFPILQSNPLLTARLP